MALLAPPPPPRFPQLWIPEAPPLRLPSSSIGADARLVGQIAAWTRSPVTDQRAPLLTGPGEGLTGGAEGADPGAEWADTVHHTFRTRLAGVATSWLTVRLDRHLAQASSLLRVARTLWPQWWASGVLPGDLPPLDRDALGRLARLLEQGRAHLQTRPPARPLTTPLDFLPLQAAIALLGRRLGVSADDPVARVWLGSWDAARASRHAPQHEAVDLSRARYLLATRGWSPASQEEASLHVWDLFQQMRRGATLLPHGVTLRPEDPWLVVLAADANAAARSAMLAVIGREQTQHLPQGAVSIAGALELARLLVPEAAEQLARHWIRSPQQPWREAGLALLTAVRGAPHAEGPSPDSTADRLGRRRG